MPIDIEALLQPIPGERPSGADLRYHPLTDQIKEARRQEDGLNQGVWKRDVKTADYAQVIKLSKEALLKHSKDLQIAAWLVEALLQSEQLAGLAQGLDLIERLLDTYWDTIYPQIDEDGDLEFRATPLRWIGSQLDSGVRSVALTQAGHNWYEYRESHTVPTEEDARVDMSKQGRRDEALADGLLTPEEFEKGFEITPIAFSQKLYADLTQLIEFVQTLSGSCDAKFGDASPDFSPLRTSLEEVQQAARMLLIKKGGLQTGQPEAMAEAQPGEGQVPDAGNNWQNTTAAAPVQPVRRSSGGTEPSSVEDAIERLLAVGRYLQREQPFNPMPYLIPRALRFGELRATGGAPDPMFLQAPPTEVRMELKRLSVEGSWDQLREKAEEAVGLPCGRAWLDGQRYAWTACFYSGAQLPAQAILSEVRALVADFPQITQWVLADDTPAANPETIQWMQQNGVFPAPPPQPAVETAPPAVQWIPPPMPLSTPGAGNDEPVLPDVYDLAMEAARSGRAEEALTMLSREVVGETSGRGKFLRKVQLAQVCLATGNDDIARPILQELAEEIERRGLEAWEGSDLIGPPLALLYRCFAANGNGEIEERHKLYARICRLDPARALTLPR
jgi:type VI secretion system protein ImpA